MEASIKLTRLAAPDNSIPKTQQHAFPICILAEGVNMPSEIFVYHVGKPEEAIPGDKFECVASVNQLFEIPLRSGMALSQETGIPYYRTSQLNFVCRSQEECEAIWKDIQETVFWLVKNFNLDNILQGTEFATVGATRIEKGNVMTRPPLRCQISYHPAGEAAMAEGVQILQNPDPSKSGWLPVSSAPPGVIVPPGAVFYYNLAKDVALSEIWPPLEPMSGNQLFRNGVLLPHGVTHVFTKDGLWWLDFHPVDLPGYLRKDNVQDGNAPWPLDYVNRNNPGEIAPNLTVILFK